MARYCQEMNNFNGLFEIVRGLTLGPVQRLVKTWAAVPPKYKLIWQELYHATYRDNDFQIYHTAFSEAVKVKLPAIPCLTILLEGVFVFFFFFSFFPLSFVFSFSDWRFVLFISFRFHH